MTKRELFESLLTLTEVQANTEFVEGLTHEIELLNRKNTGSKKPSKVTDEMVALIYGALKEYDSPITIKELIEDNFKDYGFTSQKIVPIMKVLIDKEMAIRVVEKRVAKFKAI